MGDKFYYFDDFFVDTIGIHRGEDRMCLFVDLEVILKQKNNNILFNHRGILRIFENGRFHFNIECWDTNEFDPFENMEMLDLEFENSRELHNEVKEMVRESILEFYPDDHPDKKIALGILLQTVWN